MHLLAAALVPAIFVAVAWFVGRAAGLHHDDPDYAYLLNCLRLLRLEGSGMWPHPGTTVQMVGSVTILAAWLITLGEHGYRSLYDAIVQAPEFYLNCIDAVMVMLDAVALVVLFQRLFGATKSYCVAIIGCATVLISAPAFASLHRVTPEPILLSTSLVLAAILAPVAFSTAGEKQAGRYTLAIGWTLGFSLATKLTAIPGFLFLFWTPDKTNRLRALRTAAIAALVLTLPIATHYADMAAWIFNLATRNHAYDTGGRGVPDPFVLANNARLLLFDSPETFLFLAIQILVLAARRVGLAMPVSAARILRLCVLAIALNILMALKQPAVRYLIFSVGPLCLGNAIAAYYVLAVPGVRAWMKALLTALVVMAGVTVQTASAEADVAQRRAVRRFMTDAQATGCLLIYYEGAAAVPYNLFFALDWSGGILRSNMTRAYPGFVAIKFSPDGETTRFADFEGDLSRSAVGTLAAPKKCVALVGAPVEQLGEKGIGIDPKYLTLMAATSAGSADPLVLIRLKPDFFAEAQATGP